MIPDMDSMESDRQKITSEKQMKILLQVLQEELTDLQRQTFVDFHFGNKTESQIAKERGVNKSTVCRTLKRAERKVLRITKYCQF